MAAGLPSAIGFCVLFILHTPPPHPPTHPPPGGGAGPAHHCHHGGAGQCLYVHGTRQDPMATPGDFGFPGEEGGGSTKHRPQASRCTGPGRIPLAPGDNGGAANRQQARRDGGAPRALCGKSRIPRPQSREQRGGRERLAARGLLTSYSPAKQGPFHLSLLVLAVSMVLFRPGGGRGAAHRAPGSVSSPRACPAFGAAWGLSAPPRLRSVLSTPAPHLIPRRSPPAGSAKGGSVGTELGGSQ
jgi:hypothetical protein